MNENIYKYSSEMGIVPVPQCSGMFFHHNNATSIILQKAEQSEINSIYERIKPQLLWHLCSGKN